VGKLVGQVRWSEISPSASSAPCPAMYPRPRLGVLCLGSGPACQWPRDRDRRGRVRVSGKRFWVGINQKISLELV
jgi:hypothetical protein